MKMTLLETIIPGTLISFGISGLQRFCPVTSRFRRYLLLKPPAPVPLAGHIDSLVLLWADLRVSGDQSGSLLLFFVDLVFAGSVRA